MLETQACKPAKHFHCINYYCAQSGTDTLRLRLPPIQLSLFLC